MSENWQPEERFMEAAIAAAVESISRGAGGPFGACIVRAGKALAAAGNRVLECHDPTAHAEVNAIRTACGAAGSHLLEGAVIYSTTEPCPMCFSAIHWARISRIVYGTSIGDVKRLGFNELDIGNERMRSEGRSPVAILGGFMVEECRELLNAWSASAGATPY